MKDYIMNKEITISTIFEVRLRVKKKIEKVKDE